MCFFLLFESCDGLSVPGVDESALDGECTPGVLAGSAGVVGIVGLPVLPSG